MSRRPCLSLESLYESILSPMEGRPQGSLHHLTRAPAPMFRHKDRSSYKCTLPPCFVPSLRLNAWSISQSFKRCGYVCRYWRGMYAKRISEEEKTHLRTRLLQASPALPTPTHTRHIDGRPHVKTLLSPWYAHPCRCSLTWKRLLWLMPHHHSRPSSDQTRSRGTKRYL